MHILFSSQSLIRRGFGLHLSLSDGFYCNSFSSGIKPNRIPGIIGINHFENNPIILLDPSDATHATQQIYAQEWIDPIRQSWDA